MRHRLHFLRIRHWLLVVLAVLACNAWWAAPAAWAADSPAPPVVTSPSVLLMDASSGKVLYEKNANQERPMASVTKLMTMYIAIRAVRQGKAKLNEWVPVSEEAYHVQGSQIWLEPGEQMTLDQLLKATAIGSANDAAFAIGEFLAGSEPRFVEIMNHTARQLGMTHTQFRNAHGLEAAGHYTTAHDLAILARRAVQMPLLLHYTKMWEDRTIRNGKGGQLWLINHNRLLRMVPGTDGLKTGFTNAAGFCVVGTAKRGDTRMIAVVLGASSSKARFQDAATLLNWGFQHYQTHVLAKAHDTVGQVAVVRGDRRQVTAEVTHTVAITLPRGQAADLKREIRLPESVDAPVSKGQQLGTLLVKQQSGTVMEIPLTAREAVASVSMLQRIWGMFWHAVA